MSSDGKPIVGSRVNQLDAEELDGELFTLFKAKLADVFKHVDGSFYPTYEPEIKAILKALLYGVMLKQSIAGYIPSRDHEMVCGHIGKLASNYFYTSWGLDLFDFFLLDLAVAARHIDRHIDFDWFTVWDCGSTVGQRLLGLEYFAGRGTVQRASRAQILALVSLGTLLPWLRERCLGVGLRRLPYHRRCQVERGLGHLETAVRVASVANFVLFLLRGTYCSLSARLTGVISGHAQRPMIREVAQTDDGDLPIHVTSHFTLVFMISEDIMGNKYSGSNSADSDDWVQFDFMNRELLWHGLAEFVGFLLPLVNVYPTKNFVVRKLLHRKMSPTSPYERTPSDLAHCGICAGAPTQPHEIGCRHIFCYYCIASQATADPNFACPLCNCPSLGLENLREAALPLKQN